MASNVLPKCVRNQQPCEVHKDGKYRRWSCNYKYDPVLRRQRYLKRKKKCPSCDTLISPDSPTCQKCIYKTKPHRLKGKRLPQWWRDRITNKFKSGSLHPLWKGGLSSENKTIRRSQRFKDWRTAVFERDDHTCQECFVRGGELQPHHIKPFSLYPELRFDINNGQTLCVECHRKTPTWGHGLNNMTREQFELHGY